MAPRVEIERFNEVLDALRRAFPSLRIEVSEGHPHVEASVDIPAQPGLAFDVNINLQNDELHLSTGEFWAEWFPCGDAAVFNDFLDTVVGLLSGSYRILEHLVGSSTAKAQLQRPSSAGWETIATRSTPLIFIPWRRSTRVIRNDAA
jgi:hypothetical protein